MPPTTTARDKVRRDAEIVRLRLTYPNWTNAQIAAHVSSLAPKWKISERAVKDIVATWRAEKTEEISNLNALEIVQEHLGGFRDVREQAAAQVAWASGQATEMPVVDEHGKPVGKKVEVTIRQPMPAVAVGALRLIAEMRQREIDLLQESGLLPKNLGHLDVQLDFRRTTDVFFLVLEKYVPAGKLSDALNELVQELMEVIPEHQRAGLLPERT